VNVEGLNPSGLARAAENIYSEQGLEAKVAYTTGDDLLSRLPELQEPVLSANAYLGAFGIVEALNQGTEIVI
jgi:hypothetical protein